MTTTILTIAITGQGTTTPQAGSTPVEIGSSQTFMSHPAEGWLLDHWRYECGFVHDRILTATFTRQITDTSPSVHAYFAESSAPPPPTTYCCPICQNICFPTSQQLEGHMIAVHGSQPFCCMICVNVCFATQEQLAAHMATAHGPTPPPPSPEQPPVQPSTLLENLKQVDLTTAFAVVAFLAVGLGFLVDETKLKESLKWAKES